MTFLLQKFNAINRTRTEARAWNGLRSTASGIAFTGRLAACLLLAGFLGVGSAMAQPKVLRIGGGPITVPVGATDYLHHYLIGDAATNNPLANAGGTFVLGGLAVITLDQSANTLKIDPISAGVFKIAMDEEAYDAATPIGDNGMPIEVAIMSRHAPRLKEITNNASYNAGADADGAIELLDLIPRDDTSKEYDLLKWFDDPNDVFLSYEAKVDMVAKTVADEPPETGALRPVVEEDGVNIVSATIVGNKLTITLTEDAMMRDETDVWVLGKDGGEYARKQVHVTAGTATKPYVDEPVEDMTLREDDDTDTLVKLADVFADPDVASPTRGNAVCDPDALVTGCAARELIYELSISGDATQVPDEPAPGVDFTWVTPYMLAKYAATTNVLSILPRSPGSTTITVKATDKGLLCRATHIYREAEVDNTSTTAVDETEAARCEDNGSNEDADNMSVVLKDTGLYPDAKSIPDAFDVTIVTETTPLVDNDIPDQELDADGVAKTVDMDDVDTAMAGAQAAFEDETNEGLTYTVYTSKADSGNVIATVDGSVVTLMPVWGTGGDATVKVKATNNLDPAESIEATISVTVKTATKPIVNPDPMIRGALAAGITLNTGDEARTVNLLNVTGAEEEEDYVPLFIDPNPSEGESLPGGFLFKMQIKDVDAPFRYDDLSMENDVVTSAMRLVLDPAAATLTVHPTGANYANVTVWGIDRERLMISATMKITVVSGVGTESEELPTEVSLSQNYPNPFNPQTTIDYALPKAGDVSLIVYDMLGREVDVLLDGPQAAGRHTVRFGANHLPNGTYVYRLVAADKTITRTMVLVK